MSNETQEPSIFPLVIGELELTAFDGFSYVDAQGRTYWSGVATPSAEDAADCIATPRTPPLPVPAEVTRYRFLVALRREWSLTEGELYAIISQLPAGDTQDTARDALENASVFRRANALLAAVAQIEGKTPAQMDDLFRAAASYTDLD